MADLFGTYDKRIKLTIDHTKIDSTLSDFPVTVFFTAAQAEEIFTEFDADSDYMKCAFTSSDGTTQLYAEKELFDVSESKAIYHVKVTSISSSADTDIYYYYDNGASDNTTYIGAIGTTAGASVWDSNYKAVYHLSDDDTDTTVLDSTTNYDATKKANAEPTQVVSPIGKAQDFDGTDDTISIPSLGTFGNAGFVEVWFKTDSLIADQRIVHIGNTAGSQELTLKVDADGSLRVYYYNNSYQAEWVDIAFGDTASWHYLAFAFADDDFAYFLDSGTPGDTDNSGTTVNFDDTNQSWISTYNGTGQPFDGKVDEVRISSIRRTNAWAKGSYNSTNDTLLTYGSEETGGNAIFFGAAF